MTWIQVQILNNSGLLGYPRICGTDVLIVWVWVAYAMVRGDRVCEIGSLGALEASVESALKALNPLKK